MTSIVESVLIYLREDDPELASKLVIAKEVCPTCSGHGVTWHGRSNVAFTSGEWYDMDEDDRDGYMSGRYDGPCPQCNGNNVVDKVSAERSDDEAFAEFERMCREESGHRQAQAQERAMGA